MLFCLDEFAAIGANETIEKAAGQIASFGVKLWPIIQDLPQLMRDYQHSWETFMGNAGLLTFFGNTDLTTTKHIAARLGEAEAIRWKYTESNNWQEMEGNNAPNASAALLGVAGGGGGTSRSKTKGGNQGKSQDFQRGPLMTPSEVVGCFARERGNILVLIPDKPPLVLNRLTHYGAEDDALMGGLFDPIEGQKNPLTLRMSGRCGTGARATVLPRGADRLVHRVPPDRPIREGHAALGGGGLGGA